MKKYLNRLFFLGAILAASLAPVLSAEEVLLHRGPVFSSPGLALAGPLTDQSKVKDLKFRREFFIERKLFDSLPASIAGAGETQVTAIEAIDLAEKEMRAGTEGGKMMVTELRLLQGPEGQGRRIEYYLVFMLVDYQEQHRIVLMNRAVLAPRLRRVKE